MLKSTGKTNMTLRNLKLRFTFSQIRFHRHFPGYHRQLYIESPGKTGN